MFQTILNDTALRTRISSLAMFVLRSAFTPLSANIDNVACSSSGSTILLSKSTIPQSEITAHGRWINARSSRSCLSNWLWVLSRYNLGDKIFQYSTMGECRGKKDFCLFLPSTLSYVRYDCTIRTSFIGPTDTNVQYFVCHCFGNFSQTGSGSDYHPWTFERHETTIQSSTIEV